MSIGKHKSKTEQEGEMFFSLQNIDTEGATAKKTRQASNLPRQEPANIQQVVNLGNLSKKNQKQCAETLQKIMTSKQLHIKSENTKKQAIKHTKNCAQGISKMDATCKYVTSKNIATLI